MKKYRVPTIETERLYLRMWNKKDAADFYEYAQSPNVGPVAGWKPHTSQAESKQIIVDVFLQKMAWAIVDKATEKVIGGIGFEDDKFRPDIHSKELGYSLSEDFWGRGLMTEAAQCIVEYAFEDLRLDILSINTTPGNRRSQRVIEKCGFKYEGTLRRAYRIYDGTVTELRCYSMFREEYMAMKRGECYNG